MSVPMEPTAGFGGAPRPEGRRTLKDLLPGEVAWCTADALVYDPESGDALYLKGESTAHGDPGRRWRFDHEEPGSREDLVPLSEPMAYSCPVRVEVTAGEARRVVVDVSLEDDEELRDEIEPIEDDVPERASLVRVHELTGTDYVPVRVSSESEGEREEGAILPEHLHRRTLQNLIPGEEAWCVPWALVYDPESGNALYLNGDRTAHIEPGGSVKLRVERLDDGRLVVDAREVDDEELRDDVDPLPKREDAEGRMRVDELVGTSLARSGGRYAPEKGEG